MKLSEAMREKMLLSFELFPPKTEKGMANLPGTIEHLMKYRPEYISCTYGAGGGNVGANREVCQMIRNAGSIPVTHFTVIKKPKEYKILKLLYPQLQVPAVRFLEDEQPDPYQTAISLFYKT